MMHNYAVVQDGIVINVVVWDGETDWSPPDGSTTVQISADSSAGIGLSYDGSIFTAPQ